MRKQGSHANRSTLQRSPPDTQKESKCRHWPSASFNTHKEEARWPFRIPLDGEQSKQVLGIIFKERRISSLLSLLCEELRRIQPVFVRIPAPRKGVPSTALCLLTCDQREKALEQHPPPPVHSSRVIFESYLGLR